MWCAPLSERRAVQHKSEPRLCLGRKEALGGPDTTEGALGGHQWPFKCESPFSGKVSQANWEVSQTNWEVSQTNWEVSQVNCKVSQANCECELGSEL